MPSATTSVLFSSSVRGVKRELVRNFHERLRAEVADGQDFSCLITGDRTLRRLNRDFLGHDYATDVLSFPSGEPRGESLGDIAISLDRAREQAGRFGHGVEDEIRILMLHGVLHLQGFDHEVDRGRMARAETRWRKRFGLPLSLIARSRGKDQS